MIAKLFRTDPDVSLQAAQSALVQAERRIGELQTERTAKIEQAEGDYLAEVAKIDRELASLRANAIIHRDRADAMQVKRREHAKARLEQEKAAGIAEIKKRMSRRRVAAAKLDEAMGHLATASAELIAEDDALYRGWPDMLPSASRLNYTRGTVLDTLPARRRIALIRELAALAPSDFGVAIDQKNVELIAELEQAAVPELPAENAA
jgi:antitoxin component HigA of HigAB toxin-antitoxin module